LNNNTPNLGRVWVKNMKLEFKFVSCTLIVVELPDLDITK